VPRADRRHHREAGHRVQRRADDAAVQALVREVADELGPHRQVAAGAARRQGVDAQAEHAVERDALLEHRGQGADELVFERRRGGRSGHGASCRRVDGGCGAGLR
jgi:hypothetical protein